MALSDESGSDASGSEKRAVPQFLSWGRYPSVEQEIIDLAWEDDAPFPPSESMAGKTFLAQGQGRSYGDVCLNANNFILSTRHLNSIRAFDRTTGRLRCQSGVTLDQLLRVIVPAGWFLPVSPGTRFVSIGGAIANDIHGKNHHRAGTFGRHVLSLTLVRSDGKKCECSPVVNADLFRASIGGLGLTGLILEAEIQLMPIESPFINQEEIQFRSLDEFRDLSKESAEHFEYTVAWIDCVSLGKNFSRGVFIRGNHSRLADLSESQRAKMARANQAQAILRAPLDAPPWLLNSWTVQLFNTAFYHKQRRKIRSRIVPYSPFFYPLDSVLEWNRIYGKRGFFQFQCVLPHQEGERPLKKLFRMVVDSGEASFLAVLKEFGELQSPGLLSFPRVGTTLCLDFANRGPRTVELLGRLEREVIEQGGALYPAKDALMEAESFRRCYPSLEQFRAFMDPKFSSSFWRRVIG